MSDVVILSSAQRRKAVLGKAFNSQHDLLDLIFKDSYDNKFNNFINLYERSSSFSPNDNVVFEVKTDFKEKIYLQWNHGVKGADGFPLGMRFPGFITYMKSPTTEKEPHKIVDVDLKNMVNFVDLKYLEEFAELIKSLETANINSKLMSEKDVARLHEIVDYIGNVIGDELGKYSWVGGVFWGGKGFSYWGDWTQELMKGLAEAHLVDPSTNVGEKGYHAQRLCSMQILKPTLVTNYLCNGGFDSFRFSSPGFFVLKNDVIYPLLERYYKMNFVTTFKSTVPLEKQIKWQEAGETDLRLWEEWSAELIKIEDEIKTVIFSEKQ